MEPVKNGFVAECETIKKQRPLNTCLGSALRWDVLALARLVFESKDYQR